MGFPLDLNFTNFVTYPGSPSTPGASDVNRWNAGISNLAGAPSCQLVRTDAVLVPTSFAPIALRWNLLSWRTDPLLTFSPVDNGHMVTDIFLPYPGVWEVGAVVRSQTNNSSGYTRMWLQVVQDTADPYYLDIDEQPNRIDADFANVLRCGGPIIVNSTNVAQHIRVRVLYAQISGGTNSLTTLYPAYPKFWARWVNTGGLY